MGKHVDVSLDIEACGEVVLSIGACEFDRATGTIDAEFYVVLDVAPQLAAGLRMDAGAFIWWLKQSDLARVAVCTDPQAPAAALTAFGTWLRRDKQSPWVWAYPTSYDLPAIERCCRAFGVKVPWQWTRTMDARTLWQLAIRADPRMAKIEKDAGKTDHHALADAKQQVVWIMRYLSALPAAPAEEGL